MPGYERVTLDATELTAITGPWGGLWRECGAPVFQHPAWTMAWLGLGSSACAHALFDKRKLVALAVLVDSDGGRRFAGHPLNDANELLSVDAPAGAALLEAMVAGSDAPVSLDLLEPEGPTARLLRGVEGLDLRWTAAEPCPTLPVGARPSPRLRARFAAERRRAEVRLRCEVPTASGVAAFVDRRLARWSERGRLEELGAAERDPGFPQALGRACTELGREGLCHLAALVVDGEVVAEDLYLGDRRAPLLYMRSFKPSDVLSSPGLQLAVAVRDLPAVGEIDLGRGDEPYKLRLGARPDVRIGVELSPSG